MAKCVCIYIRTKSDAQMLSLRGFAFCQYVNKLYKNRRYAFPKKPHSKGSGEQGEYPGIYTAASLI